MSPTEAAAAARRLSAQHAIDDPSTACRLAFGDGDADVRLLGIGALRGYLEAAEAESVALARAGGLSWSYIAALLGKAKQNVWRKHRGVDE